MEHPLSDRVALRVKELRHARGWTAAQLADVTKKKGREITRGKIAKIESRIQVSVTVEELDVFSRALDVTLEELLYANPRKSR